MTRCLFFMRDFVKSFTNALKIYNNPITLEYREALGATVLFLNIFICKIF